MATFETNINVRTCLPPFAAYSVVFLLAPPRLLILTKGRSMLLLLSLLLSSQGDETMREPLHLAGFPRPGTLRARAGAGAGEPGGPAQDRPPPGNTTP